MELIKIKPLSVNDAWKGRRFRSAKYNSYRQSLFNLLPKISIPEGKKQLNLIVGFSSKGSDVDNILKPFIDVLQLKYKFNDSAIYKIIIEKEIVKKGSEFVKFEFEKYLKQ